MGVEQELAVQFGVTLADSEPNISASSHVYTGGHDQGGSPCRNRFRQRAEHFGVPYGFDFNYSEVRFLLPFFCAVPSYLLRCRCYIDIFHIIKI